MDEDQILELAQELNNFIQQNGMSQQLLDWAEERGLDVEHLGEQIEELEEL